MSKTAARFEKRTGWGSNAAGGASPKRQPYHVERRDVGVGILHTGGSILEVFINRHRLTDDERGHSWPRRSRPTRTTAQAGSFQVRAP